MQNMREHVVNLGKHGVLIATHDGKKEPLDGEFYDKALELCRKYGLDCIGYAITVPEASNEMMIAIWKNGHVDSGDAESIRAIMRQEVW